MMSTGSPGASRTTAKATRVIPSKVGIALSRRSTTNRLTPPELLLHVPRLGSSLPLARVRPGLHVLDLLVHAEQIRARKTEVVRLLLIENLVRPLERILAFRLAAMR